jgi:hypothetical protein
MLELDDGKKMIEELWEKTTAKVELSDSLRKRYFAVQGPMPTYYDNQRTYHRYFMRGKAVLQRGDALFGTYTKDISRQGVGFLSPVQLLPKEIVKLRLPTTELSLEIARCRRVEPGCFDCGARFALEPGQVRSTN